MCIMKKKIGELAIYKADKEHIVHNTRYDFADCHTHIRSIAMAEIIAKNVRHKKRPRTHNRRLLESHIILSDDAKYRGEIEELISARCEDRKEKYVHTIQKRGSRR